MKRFLTLPSFLLVALSLPASAGTYVVSNLNNYGSGTLAQAITSANADPGSTITFATSGTLNLSGPLPYLTKPVTIDGTTAPGYNSAPVVSINFAGNPGLTFATGADDSVIKGLSLVGSTNSALTLQASRVTVQDNYIGLTPNGILGANKGDGVKIIAPSGSNVIGNEDAVRGVTYANTLDTSKFTVQPVSFWQGLRNYGDNASQYLICGTSDLNGLLYTGPIDGGGKSYLVQFPGSKTESTSVYGPDNLALGKVRLVGSFKRTGETSIYNHGFYWDGTLDQLPSGGVFRAIDYPGAKAQFTHSTMGNLAVGNSDGPRLGAARAVAGGEVAYIYDIKSHTFVKNIVFPGSKTTTAYGIWANSSTTFTICGGYSPVVANNLLDEKRPLTQGKAYLVDYDATTGRFSNWASFDYPNGATGLNFITHFEGISSAEPGVYTLVADSVQTGTADAVQGSWVRVLRNADNSFSVGTWVDLSYPGYTSPVSANSVYANQVVGVVGASVPVAYQATVRLGFKLSNVISGNGGNGISVNGAKNNIISMNYIGTDPTGSVNKSFGNGQNGILITGASAANLIGGQVTVGNNPTGDKGTKPATIVRPPQGNLISGNHGNGVRINAASSHNLLSGNFIGTDATGTNALGNTLNGVDIDSADDNALIGCTFFQNPFTYYNVIGGNLGHGVRVNNSDNATIQANFIGMAADNVGVVANHGDGLLVSGDSTNTLIGGLIPLGNVIAGNKLNGTEIADTASGSTSWNTFGGSPAFKTVAAPNGQDGILVTATGGNHLILTCLFSGNKGNGIEIGGDASKVYVTGSTIGTDTIVRAPIPNWLNGIAISGTAHDNIIGYEPAKNTPVDCSGNRGYGIAVLDYAHDNIIYHTRIGTGPLAPKLPNRMGGIYLDQGTSHTVIGGAPTQLQNIISNNLGDGITMISTTKNAVVGNSITANLTGIYADGTCTGTVIKTNTITGNTETNVDISSATGINYQP